MYVDIIMSENFFLVDTNIIIAYVNNENENLKKFIEDNNNYFYYTETVEKEFNKPVNGNTTIPSKFNKILSKIENKKIEIIMSKIQETIKLSEQQINKFKNDLSIILEAGFICYDILPKNVYTEPQLLTNNLKLYKKFIDENNNKTMLEDLINLHGLEHLIKVIRPGDIIPGY